MAPHCSMRQCHHLSLRESLPKLLHRLLFFWRHETRCRKVAHEFRVIDQVEHPETDYANPGL